MKPYKWLVTAISLFLMFGNKLLPPILGLNPVGMAVLCIFAGTMALLLLVDLNWPLLLCIFAFVNSGVYTMTQAVANSLGNATFWFIALSGLLIAALEDCGIIRRLALWFLTRPYNKGHPWRFIGSLMFATLLIGSIMDPTALAILLAALAEEILSLLGRKKGDRFGELLMIAILVCVAVSYGITPIGHPVPVTVITMLGELETVNFLSYSIVGYAIAAAFFVIVMLLFRFVFKIDVSVLENFDPATLVENQQPLDRKGKISCAVYIFVIVMWLLPSLVQNFLPGLYAKLSLWGSVTPLIIGIILLNLIHEGGAPILEVGTRFRDIPWMACLPAAAGFLLGGSLSLPEAGITEMLATNLGPVLSNVSPFMYVLILCMFCTVMTTFSSDMVTCVLAVTISLSLIQSGVIQGVNITGLCAAIGISSACCVATAPGAAYSAYMAGQGWISPKNHFLEVGLCGIIAGLLCALVGYNLACFIF